MVMNLDAVLYMNFNCIFAYTGHQCYRHMFLDRDYCFDPHTQDECNRKPNALTHGRTVFFAVQPRYMNVDIRIIVDVAEGKFNFHINIDMLS